MVHSHKFLDENNPLSQTIPDSPTELKFFIKLCEQRRKFPVLYKIEFTVSTFNEWNKAFCLQKSHCVDCGWNKFMSACNQKEQFGEKSKSENDSVWF